MLGILLILGGIILALQLKTVQTWGAKRAAVFLSKELKTKVGIKSLYLKPFKSLVLEGFYIEDLQQDTLISAPRLVIDIAYFAPFRERKIDLNNIELYDGKFYLKRLRDSSTNLAFIINYFNSGKVDTTKTRPFDVSFDKITVKNFDFRYKNFLEKDTVSRQVNFNDLRLRKLNIGVVGLDVKNHILKAQINKLSFIEKSGFVLDELTAETLIDTNTIVLKKFFLRTPKSRWRDYLSMQFKDFGSFDDFNNKVELNGNFEDSKIMSSDVAFFTSSLSKMDMSIEIDGKIKGRINNLEAKELQLKVGRATYVKGDFAVKGLPNLNKVYLDLKFDQLATNKTDLDYIVFKTTGNKKSQIPIIVKKFGNVNFRGNFKGFTNNFAANGEFKTKLGRLISNIKLKIEGGVPAYKGKIHAIDFNIGQLLDEKMLGETTLKADIDGRGFELKNLREKLNANIAYLDFKKYRYRNIALNGTYTNQFFKGKLSVKDKNLNLNFDGSVDLKPNLPVYSFYSDIQHANLRATKLLNDTVSLTAVFKTNFTGNSLENIQGNIHLDHITVVTNKKSFALDSIDLMANGLGDKRLLALTSDIGDASIRGQYDLSTLPSAFKVIVKRYIPSLKTTIINPKKQNFQFNFDLKNMDAVTSIFLPALSIPERGSFNGKFNSDSGLVSLSGFVKTIKYDGIVYKNLIIDQNTLPKSLEAIISLDRVNISDSVYIQNVVIQNTLKNDSLSFNVKLSDKTATNQLDLYGLVEFGLDTTAKLSILPSDIIIDNQVWKVQDKARIKFDNNKIKIEGFALSNNNQLVAVNGIISKNPDDVLDVVIENLNLKSLSKLTQGTGLNLSGTMNGNVSLASILANPDVKSDIKVDSLQYNTTFIGDLQLASTFNNQTRNIDVSAIIDNKGLKTMVVNGSINIKSETDNLNLNVGLDKTELILFDPFVNQLVSRLSGQISADLKITGPFKNPKINGSAGFVNAGLTVNYLNTAYTINDKVTIENSVININDLGIRDIRNNVARVNGTVDLRDPANPDIEVNLNASNFMALNTTAKNNLAYYGLAYATGDFNFNGPVDALRIVINAKTEAGTVFTIPLNGASTASSNDFIFYVSKDSLLNKKETEGFFKGIVMEFELAVGETSQVNILTDVGNLTGAGNADLRLLITSLGDFEMYGDYVINRGKFDFTANNVINKTFDIKKGGDIRWTGNPSNANINLNAVYTTRTPLAPLYLAAGQTQTDDSRNETVLAEANMFLSGSLLSPDIRFALEFPNNTDIKTRLGGYLNNKDNENQQVINLVVRNSFSGSASGGIGFQNSDLLGSGLELAFSKLNNIISQSLKIKNLDLNVRSQNELGGSYRFFDERFTFRGTFSNNRYSVDNTFVNNNLLNTPLTDVTRDLEINYNIKRDASLVAKAFQRPSNRDFFNVNRDIYINGLGLVYTQEYDTFAEFWRNTFHRKLLTPKEKVEEKAVEEVPVLKAP